MFKQLSRRAALFAALSAALAVPALAQGPGFGPPPPGGGGMGRPPMMRGPQSIARTPADALADALDLSDTQIVKIVRLQVSLRKQSEALRPTPGGTRPDQATMQANGEKMRTLETKAESDITALLSASQKTKLETFKQTQQQRGGPGGGFGGPGGGGRGGFGGGRGFGGPPPPDGGFGGPPPPDNQN